MAAARVRSTGDTYDALTSVGLVVRCFLSETFNAEIEITGVVSRFCDVEGDARSCLHFVQILQNQRCECFAQRLEVMGGVGGLYSLPQQVESAP